MRLNPQVSRLSTNEPLVTICVLTYGNHLALAKRCIESIRNNTNRALYRLFVGGNAVSAETQKYLEELAAAGAIDKLILSPTNLNKCRMMRHLFAEVCTEFIWWFDDDSYITQPDVLVRWLNIAQAARPEVVHWGHQFFFGHERDFSYGTDVVGYVQKARWYKGKTPPSWEPGGKDEFNFNGRGTGDGRWFFITGGCWLVRSKTIKALDWPDPSLIKRNDDVFFCEALRQQGWECMDVGPLGVAINTEPRRGGGEDIQTMETQIGRFARKDSRERLVRSTWTQRTVPKAEGRGCVFLPTFRDTDLFEENFGNRQDLNAGIDFFVFDDNFEDVESQRVQCVCAANGWAYRKTGRPKHGDFKQDQNDRSGWNRFVWETFQELAESYEFVVKVDTDTFLIDPTWHHEFARLLAGRTAAAGSLEFRATHDVMSFWNLAKKAGFDFIPGKEVVHVQGGISAYSKKAIQKLGRMGFVEGRHVFFGEDCYLSYCCLILGIPLLEAKTVGSWWHPYRPPLDRLRELKAIHPLTRTEWQNVLPLGPSPVAIS